MSRSSPTHDDLYGQLRDLSNYDGILRKDLAEKLLSSKLGELWQIESSDIDDLPVALCKTEWQLERLIEMLPTTREKLIARFTFNFPSEGLEGKYLHARWAALRKHEDFTGASSRPQIGKEAKEILEFFARSLVRVQPPPTPDKILATVRSPQRPPWVHPGPSPLLDMARAAPYRGRVSTPRPEPQTSYIKRQRYHEEFELAVSEGHRLIALVGLPGTGKSRLAEELVAAASYEFCIYLRTNDRSSLLAQLASELSDRDTATFFSMETEQLERAFAAHLSSDDAPDALILDDVEDSSLIARLVPPRAMLRTLVVVTSREDVLPAGYGKAITVTAMEEREAKELAQSLLPDASRQELHELVEVLGMLPLAIDHVCVGLLKDGVVDIEDACESLESDAARVMTQAGSRAGRTLTAAYKAILGKLEELELDGVQPAALLKLLGFLGPTAIPLELILPAFESAIGSDGKSGVALDFQAAANVLLEKHLITQHNDIIEIHSFTQALLRSILRTQDAQICQHLYQSVLRRLFKEEDLDALGYDSSLITWREHMWRIIHPLIHSRFPVWHRMYLDIYLLVLVRLSRQLPDDRIFEGVAKVMRDAMDRLRMDAARNPIMLSEHWFLAYLEWIEVEYLARIRERDSFRNALSFFVNIIATAKLTDFWPRQKNLKFLLRLTQSWIHSRDIELADELLEILEAAIEPSTDKLPVEDRAKYYLLRAETALHCNGLEPAVRYCENALELYQKVQEADLIEHDRLRALIVLTNALAFMGDKRRLLRLPAEYASEFVDARALVRYGGRYGSTVDNLLIAYANHLIARTRALSLLDLHSRRLEVEGVIDSAWIIRQYRRLLEEGGKFARYYESARATGLIAYLGHDILLVSLLALEQALGAFTRVLPFGQVALRAWESSADVGTFRELLKRENIDFSGDLAAAAEFANTLDYLATYTRPHHEPVIAMQKIRSFAGQATPQDAFRFREIAYSIASEGEPEYWYCEALVLACVAAAQSGVPYSVLLPPLREGFTDIGRTDRWDKLQAALEHLPNDLVSFVRTFSYFLSY